MTLPQHTQPSQAKILIVDDHPLVLSGLANILAGRGYIIETADCGLEAVRLLNTSLFDLVLLDLLLPDISGLEVMDYMHEHHMDVCVVVISGSANIDNAIGALHRGAFDFLRKTFPKEELLKTVGHALRQRWLAQDNQRLNQQLQASEKIHRYLLDSSPDIIYTLDEQGHLTYVNDRILPLLGWTAQELIGQHYTQLIHPSDLRRAEYALRQSTEKLQTTRNVELRMQSRHADSSMRLFSHELMRMTLPLKADDSPSTPPRWGTYGIAHDLTEHQRIDALVAHQAYHDILTGLPNRALFKDRLTLALLNAQRHHDMLAVMVLDIDRFKLVNDSLGHDLGDILLVEIAHRLKAALRGSDTLSRLGGDEFTVLLTELTTSQDATQLANQCQACLRQPITLNNQVIHVSASLGIALYPEHGDTADDLLKHADVAMYHQKANGKDGVVMFDTPMLQMGAEHMMLEHELHLALTHGELEMYYQPQVDAQTRQITGAEALMRWNHPLRGLLGAGEFLPLAEETGLIIPMTDWLLQAVCKDLKAFNQVSKQTLRMSINLPPQYLDRGNFVEKLQDVLRHHGLSAAQFEVEVTENICIRNPLNAIEQLNTLRRLGVRIAIDDFGTGYSSLSYLHKLPLDTLKIDRSFVMAIHADDSISPVVMAIISVAKGLNLHLVAEGVETETQLRTLAQAGCHTIQGFYFFKPMPKQALLLTLQKN